jgi:hypothetical protein
LELFEQLKTKKWNYIIKTSYPSHIYWQKPSWTYQT